MIDAREPFWSLANPTFSKRIARIEVEARDYIATNRGGRLSGCDTRSARLEPRVQRSIKSRFVGVPRVLCLFRAKTIKGCRGSLSLHENTRSSHIYFVPLKLFSARKIRPLDPLRFHRWLTLFVIAQITLATVPSSSYSCLTSITLGYSPHFPISLSWIRRLMGPVRFLT